MFLPTASEAPERGHLAVFLSVSSMGNWGQLSNLSIITTVIHILRWNKTRTTKKKYKRLELHLQLMSKMFQSSGNFPSSGSFRIYFKASVKMKWKEKKWYLGLQIAVVTFLWLDLALLNGVFPLKVRSCLHILRKYLTSGLVKNTTHLINQGIYVCFSII